MTGFGKPSFLKGKCNLREQKKAYTSIRYKNN